MRAAFRLSALLLVAVPSVTRAQAAECSAFTGNAGRVCTAAVGEAGYQDGKNQNLTTVFEDFETTKGRFYAGLGLRVGL